MQVNRPKYSELDPAQRKRSNARAYANVYLRRKKITRGPCSFRGCPNPGKKMHHDDYNKPLEIKWYCDSHSPKNPT